LGRTSYLKYIGREGIYVERGCVLAVTVDAVHDMEASTEGANFKLAIRQTLFQPHEFWDRTIRGF
jgi:hypothetical protein